MNSQDVVAEKFRAMKEEVQKRKSGSVIGGSSHALKSELIPSWDMALEYEQPHDGNALFDWVFVQGSRLEKDWRVDQERKEI